MGREREGNEKHKKRKRWERERDMQKGRECKIWIV